MFDLLKRTCKRCRGALVNEWKIDLPGYIEIVCLNCGARFWEKVRKRRTKKTKNSVRKDCKKNNKYLKRYDRSVRADIVKCFEEDRQRQILKHQSENKKNRRGKKKTNFTYWGKQWQEV